MRHDWIITALAVIALPVQGALASLTPARPDIAPGFSEGIFPRPVASAPALPPPSPQDLADLVSQYEGDRPLEPEMDCLATAVYFEAKSEPLDGQLAVAQTILNRTRSGRFPTTICGVVLQPRQFSFVRGGAFPTVARDNRQWQTAQAIAHIAVHGLWTASVDDALYFHARHRQPGWRLERISALGNHIFYR